MTARPANHNTSCASTYLHETVSRLLARRFRPFRSEFSAIAPEFKCGLASYRRDDTGSMDIDVGVGGRSWMRGQLARL